MLDTFPPAKLVREKTTTFDVYLTLMSLLFHTQNAEALTVKRSLTSAPLNRGFRIVR